MVTLLIIALNLAVFVMWSLAGLTSPEFMTSNFLVSWAALMDGRWWTFITSVFSHMAFYHLLINMFVLFGFGQVLENIMGPLKYIIFYLLAGVAGSFGHSYLSAFYLGKPELPALGASGAVSGLLLTFSLFFPREKILIMGLIPVPAIVGSILFVGFDIWGLISQSRDGIMIIGHGAHLGGALFGLFYYLLSLKFKSLRYRHK